MFDNWKLCVWELLVPKKADHTEWDKMITTLCGGSTILPSVLGYWIDGNGEQIREGMVPVRLACTKRRFVAILKFTKAYYGQEAVIGYKISNNVLLL